MKKALRSTFSVALLASLAVTQMPKSGDCQMAYGMLWATNCQMSCCHTKLPMPSCPLLESAVPRDTIASPGAVLKMGLLPLHTFSAIILPQTNRWSTFVADVSETVAFLLIGPLQATRAPPANIHLLAA